MLALTKLVHFLFLIVFLYECRAKNYCGPGVCNDSQQHTLCRFQSEDPARHCFDFEKTIKTSKEKQAILDKLNSRRNKVAAGEIRSLPSAGDMMKLEWNTELELSAQRWANQCVKHSAPDIKDTCRDLGSVFVGQNIATIYGEAPGLTSLSLVDVWYMELLNVNASVMTRYQPSSETGYSHYDYFTQLVWAKSKQVGCGGVKFKEHGQHPSEKKRAVYRLVCNFAPGGNLLNQYIFTEGPPCSICPEGTCDSVYTSLCSSKPTTIKSDLEWKENEPTTSLSSVTRKLHIGTQLSGKDTERNSIPSEKTKAPMSFENDDIFTPPSYFTHIHDFVMPSLLTTTKKPSSCKDSLVVDDFLELLKNKLSTDPMFKEFLQTNTMPPEKFLDAYDAQALAKRVYSKNAVSTTTKSPEREYVNSTLLVDLVEAIIFRNGDRMQNTVTIKTTHPEQDVSPVKIQAELGEVRHNADFSGHLFFPEDLDSDDKNIETTESYYDIPSLSPSDVGVGDLKRSKATKDFLEEILESESVPETLTKNTILNTRRKTVNLKNTDELKRLKRKASLQNIYDENEYTDYVSENISVPTNFKKNMNPNCNRFVIKYNDLLEKLASDLKVLKLNERFHCAHNYSGRCFVSTKHILLYSLITSGKIFWSIK